MSAIDTETHAIPDRNRAPLMRRQARSASAGAVERLRASPNFALNFTMDGRPYVAKEVEPYIQYWLTERYRILLSLFSGRRGETIASAIAKYFRFTGTAPTKRDRTRLAKAIEDMRGAGILAGLIDDTSRYSARMARDYLTHRPFPTEIADFIVRSAPVVKESRVLDIAGGPGSLALAMAHASDHVSLMELSRGFLAAAKREAKRLGVPLSTIHESCNRLVFQDEAYDVVTVSQALHWLDDVLVCRGICRNLNEGGSFFVIQSSITLPDSHPLSFILGDKSVLGHKVKQPFAEQVEALHRRLTLLFEALDAPDVHRIDPAQNWKSANTAASRIVPTGTTLFRQTRPFALGFARAFLSPAHIAATGQSEQSFWTDLKARCATATPAQLDGTLDWAVLHFRKGGPRRDAAQLRRLAPIAIGWNTRSPPA